ncbi:MULTISPECIES: hypothetical protein, partial [unclassified Flavobacterium]|uniref:hypothetical protein n=2 Tax=Flavobacterium TaxID=237 RepID=UPI0025BF0176
LTHFVCSRLWALQPFPPIGFILPFLEDNRCKTNKKMSNANKYTITNTQKKYLRIVADNLLICHKHLLSDIETETRTDSTLLDTIVLCRKIDFLTGNNMPDLMNIIYPEITAQS